MRSRRLLLSPLAAFALACVISAGTYAAFVARTEATGNSVQTGSVHLHDNDSDAAMLELTNAGLGDFDTSCIRVTSDGTLPSDVRLSASSAGDLAPHLRVRVTRGTGAAGFDDCAGFTADPRDYYGLGGGVVYDGRLSDLPSSWAGGVRDPSEVDHATASAPLMAARANLVGLWEIGEITRRVDEFSGTTGAVLNSRPELRGGNWARQAISTSTAVLTASGRLRLSQPGLALYRQSVSTTAAQVTTVDVSVRSATGEAGLLTRMQTTGDSGYLTRYVAATGTWELGTLSAGTFTALDSWTNPLPAGDTARLAVTSNGATTSATIDGIQRLSATDATFAMSTYAGVRLSDTAATDDFSGVQLDNFRTWSPTTNARAATVGTTGTFVGAPVLTAGSEPSPTEPHSGLRFDGVDDALALPAAGLTTTATIAGWFDLSTGNVTLRDSTDGATDGWSLGFDDGSGTLKFRASGEIFDTGVPFGALRGDWHHHALVRNGSDVRYFLDGREVFAGTVTATTAPVSPLIVMADGLGTDASGGDVDHVAVWSRALDPDELAAMHDGVSAPALWEQGEHHWYRVRVSVSEDVAAASKSATASLVWEARSR